MNKQLRTIVKDRVVENLPNIDTIASCHSITKRLDESHRDFADRIKELIKAKDQDDEKHS